MVVQLLFDAIFPAAGRHSIQVVNAVASKTTTPTKPPNTTATTSNKTRRVELQPKHNEYGRLAEYRLVFADDKSPVDAGPLAPDYVRDDYFTDRAARDAAYLATHRLVQKTCVQEIRNREYRFVRMPLKDLMAGYLTQRNDNSTSARHNRVTGDKALMAVISMFSASKYDDITTANAKSRRRAEVCVELGSDIVSAQITRHRCENACSRRTTKAAIAAGVAIVSGVLLLKYPSYCLTKQIGLLGGCVMGWYYLQQRAVFQEYSLQLHRDLQQLDWQMDKYRVEYENSKVHPECWERAAELSNELGNTNRRILTVLPYGYDNPKDALDGLDDFFLDNRGVMLNNPGFFKRLWIMTGLGVHPYIQQEPNLYGYSTNRYDSFLDTFTSLIEEKE